MGPSKLGVVGLHPSEWFHNSHGPRELLTSRGRDNNMKRRKTETGNKNPNIEIVQTLQQTAPASISRKRHNT